MTEVHIPSPSPETDPIAELARLLPRGPDNEQVAFSKIGRRAKQYLHKAEDLHTFTFHLALLLSNDSHFPFQTFWRDPERGVRESHVFHGNDQLAILVARFAQINQRGEEFVPAVPESQRASALSRKGWFQEGKPAGWDTHDPARILRILGKDFGEPEKPLEINSLPPLPPPAPLARPVRAPAAKGSASKSSKPPPVEDDKSTLLPAAPEVTRELHSTPATAAPSSPAPRKPHRADVKKSPAGEGVTKEATSTPTDAPPSISLAKSGARLAPAARRQAEAKQAAPAGQPLPSPRTELPSTPGREILHLLPLDGWKTEGSLRQRAHVIGVVHAFAAALAEHLQKSYSVSNAELCRNPLALLRRTDLAIERKDPGLGLAVVRFAHLTAKATEYLPAQHGLPNFAPPSTRLRWIQTGAAAEPKRLGESPRETPTKTKSSPRPNRAQLMDLLMNARQADWVQLVLEDGRTLQGVITFNEFKFTGRLINLDEEYSHDFHMDQVVDVKS